MPTTAGKKKFALNVYLLKPKGARDTWSDSEILAQPIGASGKPTPIKADRYPLGPSGQLGTLFIRKPVAESEPEWLDLVRPGISDPAVLGKLKNRSVSALLVVQTAGRQFAIAFGHGRFMIESKHIEDRFGVRAVLNSISPDKVASIDRQTFDASPRISRSQTIKASSVSDYMINPDQDLLRGLVGFTKPAFKDALGTLIAGMDSLKTTIEIDLDGLTGLLKAALSRSEVKDYLVPDADGTPSQFAWVENLQPVKDRAEVSRLELELWKRLSSKNRESMWLAVPDIVNWVEVRGFSYRGSGGEGENVDVETNLDLATFLATLRTNATLETVKNREILMLMAGGAPPQRFNAFKCIYAEIKERLSLFILHAGTWFKVEPKFQKAVEDYFANIPRKPFSAPFIEYAHNGEGPYNEAVRNSSPLTYAILDRRLVQFGGTHDKIEACDLLKIPAGGAAVGYEFIHVKRGRASSSLSHLFSQGLVASTLLLKEADFVTAVNKQLAKQGVGALPTTFKPDGNEVVYAIIDGPAGAALDLPFFSKVTLQNCGKTIRSYGYRVSLMHIPESAAYLAGVAATAAAKAAKKSPTKALAGAKVPAKARRTSAKKRKVAP